MQRRVTGLSLTNALVRKLESGNGSIKNMRLLLPIDDECLVPVVVVGISFNGYARSGVAVLVRPADGYGTLSVGATNLLDDTKAARALYTAKAGCAEYLRNHTPGQRTSLKGWREAVIRERLSLNDKQRKTFDALAPTYCRDCDILKGIADASEYTLGRLFEVAVKIRFGIGDDQKD